MLCEAILIVFAYPFWSVNQKAGLKLKQ